MKSSVVKKVLMALAVMVAVVVMFSVTAFAEDYGNFSYTPVNPENEGDFEPYIVINSYNLSDDATETVVEIPAEIEDVPVTEIGASAFNGRDTLTEVIIPDSVKTISNAAFANCKGLKIVIVPDSVEYIGDSAFQGCDALEYVVLGNGLKTMGSLAFKDCKALKALDLGDSVEAIGNGAFFGCDALMNVVVPASVKNIGSLAFGYVQDGDTEKTVDGFTFYADNNAAVTLYNTAEADNDATSVVAAFTVKVPVAPCGDSAHSVKMANIRVATDSYEGLDVAQCDKCFAIVTSANTDVEEVPGGISQYISLIIGVLCVAAVVVYAVIYIKKAKAHREKAIAEYKEGKVLSDVAEKEAYEAKLEAKYQKKRAKQEKKLEMFKNK